MHRIHHPGSLNTAIRVRGSWWQGLTALARGIALFLPLTAAQAADTVLEGTEIGILPGNQMEIILKFTGRAPQPNAFSTSGPDRLVVDLPGVKNGLKERTRRATAPAWSSTSTAKCRTTSEQKAIRYGLP